MLYVHFGFLVENPSNLFNKKFLLLLALALVGLEHSNSLLDLGNTILLRNCKKMSDNRIEKSVWMLTLPLREFWSSSMWTSSALSISSSIPVILPARSGNMRWMKEMNI